MPWEDVQAKLVGMPARDIALNFIQRWGADEVKAPLFPVPRRWISARTQPLDSLNAQVLRSIGGWSNGVEERSLYNAHVHAIQNSKRFVYIENQFFITQFQHPRLKSVKNCIGEVLVDRVCKAIENAEPWYCAIVLPAHPEGPVDGDAPLRVAYFQRIAIQQLKASIESRHPNVDVTKYIGFFCLRRYEDHPHNANIIGLEQIYVHAKLLISDDDVIIVSSANINDRSMRGPRDSEIGVRLVSAKGEDIIKRFRQRLMKMHTGKRDSTFDEVNDESISTWKELADNNAKVFETVFSNAVESGRNDLFGCSSKAAKRVVCTSGQYVSVRFKGI